MPISQNFLSILRCPKTGSRLKPADEKLIAQLNDQIGDGKLKTENGDLIEFSIDGGLVNESGETLYYVCENIPTLIATDSIPLNQL